jgi:hypothetical protein
MFDSMKAFFFTTVIDDFGSMIIPMPWREFDGMIMLVLMLTNRLARLYPVHRLACFRDDVVFRK